jgi:hypothetical protein
MPKNAPFVSQAQARAMHAAAEGRSNIGIPQSVGQKLVTEAHGQKVGKLPERVRHKAIGGAVKRPQMKW